jgi:hypothetical protein
MFGMKGDSLQVLHPSISPPTILEVCKAGLGNDCPKLA